MREKSEMLVLFMPRSGDGIFFYEYHTFDYKDNHEQCPSSHSHSTRMIRNRESLRVFRPFDLFQVEYVTTGLPNLSLPANIPETRHVANPPLTNVSAPLTLTHSQPPSTQGQPAAHDRPYLGPAGAEICLAGGREGGGEGLGMKQGRVGQ